MDLGGIDERRIGSRGLKRPIAGPQVDAVRGHDVVDAVVGEVADGDRREAGALEIRGQRQF